MFCYNCGNKVESAAECPFCHRILPPLNSTLEENALKNLREQENESSSDDGNFIPGELSVYEKHYFEKRHTLFGVMRIVGTILKFIADSDSDADFPYQWQGSYTEIQIHRDKILFRQYKNFWIICTPFMKKYGRKNKVIPIKDLTAVVKRYDDLFALQFGGKEFNVPTSFSPEGFANNLKLANPRIRLTGFPNSH